MSKPKARLITIVIFAFVVLVCVDFVALYPKAMTWILGAFAIPGAWKFVRVCYIWLQEDDRIPEPEHVRPQGRKKTEPQNDGAPVKEATA